MIDTSQLRLLATQLQGINVPAGIMATTVVRTTGEMTIQFAEELVPVLTGALKNSLTLDIDHDRLGFYAYATMDYAGYVEYGTSRMAPQPYLNPAFDRAVAVGERALQSLLARYL